MRSRQTNELGKRGGGRKDEGGTEKTNERGNWGGDNDEEQSRKTNELGKRSRRKKD